MVVKADLGAYTEAGSIGSEEFSTIRLTKLVDRRLDQAKGRNRDTYQKTCLGLIIF